MKHIVGEVHPNGKWVWTEYKEGKFDWRRIKTTPTAKTEYSMCNGFAACPKFTSTEDDAISDCVKESVAMNTRNWLYKIVDGKQEEIGHTEKFGPRDWRFISKVN